MVSDFLKWALLRKALSRVHIFVFSVIILCLTLLVFEFGLRWLGLGDPVLYRTNTSYRYALLPNQHKQRIRGASVTIDSHGLRTVQDWADPDSLKILFIGDSVTWGGTAVDDTKTFAHRTGVELKQRLGRPVVTGNAAVNGYGTDNMTARLRDEIHLIETLDQPTPQVVIEGRIVETTRDFSRELGVIWGFQGVADAVDSRERGTRHRVAPAGLPRIDGCEKGRSPFPI